MHLLHACTDIWHHTESNGDGEAVESVETPPQGFSSYIDDSSLKKSPTGLKNKSDSADDISKKRGACSVIWRKRRQTETDRSSQKKKS